MGRYSDITKNSDSKIEDENESGVLLAPVLTSSDGKVFTRPFTHVKWRLWLVRRD